MFNFLKKKNRLIMTLLARNEADIIRDNLEYHRRRGVDFFVATDNGSTDGTREIFAEYEQRGLLRLIDEPGANKDQRSWVNRMGELAVNELGAGIVIHNDADEFWAPASGDLKRDLEAHGDAEVYIVERVNVILEDTGGGERYPEDARYAVVSPRVADDLREQAATENIYLYRLGPKVAFNTRAGLLRVVQGNHAIEDAAPELRQKPVDNVRIYHFPIRGRDHFFRKAIENGRAVEQNKRLHETQSWHIKQWYAAYREGRLEEEYRKLILDSEEARPLIDEGVLEEIDAEGLIRH